MMIPAPITTTVSMLIPGDVMVDTRSGLGMIVLWRETKAQDGRIHLILAFPDGERISRTMFATKDVQILPPPTSCGGTI